MVQVQQDEPGVAYFVVVGNNAAAPSATQVKQGQDAAGGSPIYSGTITVTAANSLFTGAADSGLEASTPYDVYVVTEVRTRCVLTRGCFGPRKYTDRTPVPASGRRGVAESAVVRRQA